MRILSTSAVEFPPLITILGQKRNNHFGGWLYAFSEALLQTNKDLILGVITPTHQIKTVERHEVGKYIFYRIPSKSIEKISNIEIRYLKEIIHDFKPDLIHLNGIEYSLGLEVIEANQNKIPVLASIQGLAHIYERYSLGHIKLIDLLKHTTLRDLLKFEFSIFYQKSMQLRGVTEIEAIKKVHYFTGRTTWDKDHIAVLAPQSNYFSCNENLRPGFYNSKTWNYQKCKQHTIFCSNSFIPLKGAHFLIKALSIIIKHYPDTQLRLIGPNVLSKSFISRQKLRSYQMYLRTLILDLKLENNITFLGFLSEKKMINEFLLTNAYVLPSCIENSPNSLCEAQILGVPCISSICGGTTDFIENGKTGYLYRCEEYEQLAQRILTIFKMKEGAELLGKNARKIALERHNEAFNASKMLSIYKEILRLENKVTNEDKDKT